MLEQAAQIATIAAPFIGIAALIFGPKIYKSQKNKQVSKIKGTGNSVHQAANTYNINTDKDQK